MTALRWRLNPVDGRRYAYLPDGRRIDIKRYSPGGRHRLGTGWYVVMPAEPGIDGSGPHERVERAKEAAEAWAEGRLIQAGSAT